VPLTHGPQTQIEEADSQHKALGCAQMLGPQPMHIPGKAVAWDRLKMIFLH
jgi:hypothetical protein